MISEIFFRELGQSRILKEGFSLSICFASMEKGIEIFRVYAGAYKKVEIDTIFIS